MRSAVSKVNKPPKLIEPLVPVDLVVDHSVQVDFARVPNALQLNMRIEFTRQSRPVRIPQMGNDRLRRAEDRPSRDRDRAPGQPRVPGPGRARARRRHLSDSLVGTDSHTTMINGLGIVAWGVGGIEAEAAMLGSPRISSLRTWWA